MATMLRAVPLPLEDDPLWFKDAIIYQLHVKAFYDSNGDGIGDFRGLTEKLDYIQELGVNTVWLLPFYPSPLRDDGYDIADYFGVHPDYGTLRDFRAFVAEAHRRGLRVITELVINHTSDQHPWFQAARRAPKGSRKRDFYVWSDTHSKYAGTRIIFTDTETSNWTWDNVAQQYFWHRFFSHQPDLNFENPQVLKAVIRVMRFWLDAGVDGLRLDAIPYLCEREGTNNENLPETHAVLRKIRAALDAHYRNRMLLAEANQWPEDVRPYFGEGDECHMAFHFPVMPRIYMGVAQEDRYPIVEIMAQTPEIPQNCQWAIFLRNHDELTLEMVTDKERDYLYQVYANDPRMRINLGIRRRLAPLVDNDLDRIKLLNNLLLSLPGSPVIYYGDDIGMGDNIYVGDRNGVRTPMQWSPDRNAGFSRSDPARLYLPPIMDALYGYQAVNVEAQTRDPSSLLNWMRRVLTVRKAHQAFGRGSLAFLKPGNRKVLAYLREYEGEAILCVTNLSRAAQPVELDLAAYKGRVPVEMMGRSVFPPIGEMPYLLTLPGYGFYWFRLAEDAEVPAWHEEFPAVRDLPVLVLFAGWTTLFPEELASMEPSQQSLAAKLRAQLEDEVLPQFLSGQRWFGAKGTDIARAVLAQHAQWAQEQESWLFALLDVQSGPETASYFLPLAIVWEDGSDERMRLLGHHPVARIRRGARPGILLDAFADPKFCWAVVRAMSADSDIPLGQGTLHFRSTRLLRALIDTQAQPPATRPLGVEQSNTSVVLGNRLVLKAYRRLQVGVNPELEMGWFFTEVSPFAHAAPVAGYLEYRAQDGTIMTLALLQAFIGNQGDGWSYTVDFLERYLESERTEPGEVKLQEEASQALYTTLVRQLGVRTAQMHQALERVTGNTAFDPERVAPEELGRWVERARAEAGRTFDHLARRRGLLPEALRADADILLAQRDAILAQMDALLLHDLQTVKMRYHGDYHLGQVLVVEDDFMITDFEGEPMRPLAERRAKHSPLKDVAGMLRSFNYAVYAALKRVTAERPEDWAVYEPHARRWEQQAAMLFLEGYQGVAAQAPYNPASAAIRPLLKLFLLEKAFYELRYELDNRPDWVLIPLKGILDLASPQAPEAS